MASGSRALRWEGCCNIRDLGGLPTEDGSETRFGVVVRADDVSAIAAPPEGTVLVHCAGGVDRTGLVVALVPRVAGVGIETIAEDYAESEANWAPAAESWIEDAPDEAKRRKRRLLIVIPAAATRDVLFELEQRYGTARDYLLRGGGDDGGLARIRNRLCGG